MGKSSEGHNSPSGVPKSGKKRKNIEVDCKKCGLDALCKLLGYDEGEVNLPEGTLLKSQKVSSGETIFRAGDPFRSFFAVKSGAFKSLMFPHQDQEKVVGFHFAGEIVGADGIAGNTYTCTARALEASIVCELRLENLRQVSCSEIDLKDGIISVLGDEITFNHELKVSLIHQNSEQHPAASLLNVSSRKSERGISGQDFRLSMSRSDIASYLGLASETVSRILMKLQKLGVINIRNKNVQLLDQDALKKLANVG